MHTKLRQVITASILGFSLFAGSLSVYAAPAWSLNQPGVKIEENTAKQAYVAKRMDAYFHPPKAADFAAPTLAYTKYQPKQLPWKN